MNLWVAILVAAGIAFATKLAGYLIPAQLLSGPRTRRVTGAMPVALLAALVATQTFTGPSGTLVVDARLAAVGVAVVALLLRAPFIVVVVAGAATAAGLRWIGWG
ncbi:MAG: AzlD domain-containing protein [Humibacillus sp.]|nr:AzlD domain-containing protein [Humibacillus sp.]MDN5779139.1 AzlD domain-containing protein [Humibacillus sp.]